MTIRNRALTLLLVFGCAPWVWAAPSATWPIPRAPAATPADYAFTPAQLDALPEPTRTAQACVLYTGTTHRLLSDGHTETVIHEVIRLNSRKAIEQFGEYRNIRFDPGYEKIALHDARMIRADGAVLALEPSHAQLRDANSESATYDPCKQLVLSFPDLQIGAVMEVRWSIRGQNPECPKHFFTRHRFGDDRLPIVRAELRIQIPRDRSLRYAGLNGAAKLVPQVEETANGRSYLWRMEHRPALPRDHDLPPLDELRPEVVCSTFTSWDEVGQWQRELRRDAWACGLPIQDVVRQVAGPLPTMRERVIALTHWVRRHIRYVALGNGHDFTPHPPNRVFADRFGDCKDTTQLLAAMLRELGIPSAMAIIGTRGAGQVVESVPSPWGTHALLVVTIEGRDFWIDTTASVSGWDVLPPMCRDRIAYIIDENGTRIARTPSLRPEDHAIHHDWRIGMQHDGSAIISRSIQHRNIAALQRRIEWYDESPLVARRALLDDVIDLHPRAKVQRAWVDAESLRATDEPLRIELAYHLPEHFRGERERVGTIGEVSPVSAWLGVPLTAERTVPIELTTPFDLHHRFEISAPPGYRLSDPPIDCTLNSPWGQFSVRVQADPMRWVIETHTRLERTRIEPKDFDAFRKFREVVQRQSRIFVTMSLVPAHEDAADRLALQALLQLAPADRDAARTLASLDLQHQQRTAAEATIRRALHYHPNDRALWEVLAESAEHSADRHAAYQRLQLLRNADSRYFIAQAQLCLDEGDCSRTRDTLRPLLRRSTSGHYHATAQLLIARSYLAERNTRLAAQHLQAAEQADPSVLRQVDGLRVAGEIQLALGQSQQARPLFEQLLEQSPDDRTALAALVTLHRQQNEPETALRYLRRWHQIAEREGDHASFAPIAEAYWQLQRPDEAYTAAQKARQSNAPSSVHRVLGLVLVHRQQFDQAVFHLDRAEVDATVLHALLRSLLHLGRVKDAQERLQRLGPIERPNEPLRQIMLDLTALRQRADELERAHPQTSLELRERIACAEWLLRNGAAIERITPLLGPETDVQTIAPGLILRADVLLSKGRLREARTLITRAAQLQPDDANVRGMRGRLTFEAGQTAEAIADLRFAIQNREVPDARWLHVLAAALHESGETEEAIALQRRAVRMRPADADFREQLQRFEMMQR